MNDILDKMITVNDDKERIMNGILGIRDIIVNSPHDSLCDTRRMNRITKHYDLACDCYIRDIVSILSDLIPDN